MMGPRQVAQGALFYEFSIEEFVPQDHLMRGIDRFLDLTDVRPLLAPFRVGSENLDQKGHGSVAHLPATGKHPKYRTLD